MLAQEAKLASSAPGAAESEAVAVPKLVLDAHLEARVAATVQVRRRRITVATRLSGPARTHFFHAVDSFLQLFKAREITEEQLLERLTELLKVTASSQSDRGSVRSLNTSGCALQDKPDTVDGVLKEVAKVLGLNTEHSVPAPNGSTALSERRRFLREHASLTSARTQGVTPAPDDMPLPMRAADYGAQPEHMDNARDFVERIKVSKPRNPNGQAEIPRCLTDYDAHHGQQRFAGRPYKLKEFYNLVLQHSQQIKQTGLSSSDVLAVSARASGSPSLWSA